MGSRVCPPGWPLLIWTQGEAGVWLRAAHSRAQRASCPLREASSGVNFNTRAGESRLSLETRQPRPRERMTSWWPMGIFASNQRSMMDSTMTLSSPEGQGQWLIPDGPRPAIFGLRFPGESGRTVSSFLFSIFVFRLPRRELLDPNIRVLIFSGIPLHPGAKGPVLLASSNLQGSFSPSSCLASPFSVLFSSIWLLPLSACPEKHRFKNFLVCLWLWKPDATNQTLPALCPSR